MRQSNQLRHRKGKQQGSTIIEAMVAVFVLSIGALVLMLAQLGSVSSVLDANNQSEVARAADNYAERLAATPILTVCSKSGTTEDCSATSSAASAASSTDGNKKIYLQQTYKHSDDCITELGTTLSNAKIDSCTADANGKISIKWGAQDNKDSEGFSYTLSAGSTAP